MNGEVYSKRGCVVRVESTRGVTSLVTVDETGEAIEQKDSFLARPGNLERMEAIDAGRVKSIAAAIEALVVSPVSIERMIVSEGEAEHRCEDRVWSDRTRRVHLSLANHAEQCRVLIDLGADENTALVLTDISIAVSALGRIGPERSLSGRLRLSPNVAAALLVELIGDPDVDMMQSSGAQDGKGFPIREQRILSEPWPNWYRPSYRLRPQRLPFHVRAVERKEVSRGGIVAVALLAPVERRMVRILCMEGDESFPAVCGIERIVAIGSPRAWYPYAAGSFGAEMIVEVRALH